VGWERATKLAWVVRAAPLSSVGRLIRRGKAGPVLGARPGRAGPVVVDHASSSRLPVTEQRAAAAAAAASVCVSVTQTSSCESPSTTNNNDNNNDYNN